MNICGDHIQAWRRSLGVPDFARTSRSMTLIDMRPNVRPDMRPAHKTRNTTAAI